MSLMMTAMRVPNETDTIEKFHNIIVSEFSVCVCEESGRTSERICRRTASAKRATNINSP